MQLRSISKWFFVSIILFYFGLIYPVRIPFKYLDRVADLKGDDIAWLYTDWNKKNAALIRLEEVLIVSNTHLEARAIKFIHHKAVKKRLPEGLYEWKLPGQELEEKFVRDRSSYPSLDRPTGRFPYHSRTMVSPTSPRPSRPYYETPYYWGKRNGNYGFFKLNSNEEWQPRPAAAPSRFVAEMLEIVSAEPIKVITPIIEKVNVLVDASVSNKINMDDQEAYTLSLFKELSDEAQSKKVPLIILRVPTLAETVFHYFSLEEKRFNQDPLNRQTPSSVPLYYITYLSDPNFTYLIDFDVWKRQEKPQYPFETFVADFIKMVFAEAISLATLNSNYGQFIKNSSNITDPKRRQEAITNVKKLIKSYFAHFPNQLEISKRSRLAHWLL